MRPFDIASRYKNSNSAVTNLRFNYGRPGFQVPLLVTRTRGSPSIETSYKSSPHRGRRFILVYWTRATLLTCTRTHAHTHTSVDFSCHQNTGDSCLLSRLVWLAHLVLCVKQSLCTVQLMHTVGAVTFGKNMYCEPFYVTRGQLILI
jgi:hypothetical protein